MKTVKFFTLGCKVNQYETQAIRGQFLNQNFKEIEGHSPADIYIINTCTVTHRADSESFGLIRRAKRENPKSKIIVTGCLTELDEDKIRNTGRMSLIVKNKDKENILNFLPRKFALNKTKEFIQDIKSGISSFKAHTRAFLKIQDGCNNTCSYCKVPLVRGRSRSRDLSQIVTEAQALVRNGFKEIVLCGICLGAYGFDFVPRKSLVDVIKELEKIDGLLRLRLSSIEAGDVSDKLIKKIAESQKLCRHLHIPIQSGDDQILKKMNRSYCRADYVSLIKKIKKEIPMVAITTDVLVGFPGETQENFINTEKLIKEIIPLKVHIFPYSPRENTSAYVLNNHIRPETIKQRLSQLNDTARECAILFKRQFINKNMDVLIEACSKDKPNFWQGYTDNYIKVCLKSSRNLKNKLISLRLNKITNDSVLASIV